MTKELLKQWADDVSKVYDILAFGHTERAAEILAQTRNAMRKALAQPEQEPVACIVKGCENYKNQGRFVGNLCSSCYGFLTTGDGKYSQAYCNTQRQWVGLTEEDLKLLSAEWRIVYGAWMDDFAKDIEAKLKEKNT
jgi:hypothetical protein